MLWLPTVRCMATRLADFTPHPGALRVRAGARIEQVGSEWLALDSAGTAVARLTGPAAQVLALVTNGERVPPDLFAPADLLVQTGILQWVRHPGVSRRRFLQGGAAVAAVGITLLTLPTVAAASSSPSPTGGDQAVTATVVVEGIDVTYRFHIFTETSDFIVGAGGLSVEFVVVGGGGAGGGAPRVVTSPADTVAAGGGGAGALRFGSALLAPGATTATVGAGGTGTESDGTKGGLSSFAGIEVEGGGGGAGGLVASSGGDGGSGGGGKGRNSGNVVSSGGSATNNPPPFGSGGGAGFHQTTATPRQGGGGGGYHQAGYSGGASGYAPTPTAGQPGGGWGGNGYLIDGAGTSWFGNLNAVILAANGSAGSPVGKLVSGSDYGLAGGGGGGGGRLTVASVVAQGAYGGGNGQAIGTTPSAATAGTPNTGGGGGGVRTIGGDNGLAGANGGSGLVVVRYPVS
jgi:hypothetical protein